MAEVAHKVPWSPSQCSGVLYYLGCIRAKKSNPCWWNYCLPLWKTWVSAVHVSLQVLSFIFLYFAGCPVELYIKHGYLMLHCRTQRRGMHDLKVWPGVEADGQKSTSTPGKSTPGEDQMSRLAKVHRTIIFTLYTVSGHPQDAEIASITGVGHLQEWVIQSLYGSRVKEGFVKRL